MVYGKCKTYETSFIQGLRTFLRPKRGWLEMGIPIDDLDEGEDEE